MALPINIGKLITSSSVENERKEFKLGFDKQEAMHAITAFANDLHNWGGGYMIFGIGTDRGIPLLPPHGLNPSKIDQIQQDIVNITYKIEPYYCPIISPEIFQGKHIIVIWIPGGDNRPYKAPISLKNNSPKAFYVRKGSITQKASPTDERQLIELARKIPFDDRVNHSATIADINIALVGEYLTEIKSDLANSYLSLPKDELLRKMQIIRGGDEFLKPVNVGLLMFNNDPSRFFRGATVTLVHYIDDSGTNYIEKSLIGPLNRQILAAIEYFDNNIIKTQIRKSSETAESIRVQNYPKEAFEEALVNAIYHKSYEHESCVEINIRPDRIEILSFPGPLPPLNKQRLNSNQIVARDYRNRRIGDFLKELKLTEGRGTGIPTIRQSMSRNNSPKPIFDTDLSNTYFLTILPIQPEFLDLVLTDYQREILKYCSVPRSKKTLLEHIGLGSHYENFERHVHPLIKAGYLDLTYPHIPRTPKQRYITSMKGQLKSK